MLCLKAFWWLTHILTKSKISSLDAERHRRTPRLSAISGKAIDVWVAVLYGLWPIQCATLAEIGDAAITVLSNFGTIKAI